MQPNQGESFKSYIERNDIDVDNLNFYHPTTSFYFGTDVFYDEASEIRIHIFLCNESSVRCGVEEPSYNLLSEDELNARIEELNVYYVDKAMLGDGVESWFGKKHLEGFCELLSRKSDVNCIAITDSWNGATNYNKHLMDENLFWDTMIEYLDGLSEEEKSNAQ